jgi:zinc/manganese transport system substrate-binding protein
MRRQGLGAVLLLPPLLAGACASGRSSATASAGRKLQVVAAENMWGSIAAQLGGDRVTVKSIIDNPATDPHDYEPTAADARALASARYTVVNGIGYDPWADRLLDANPDSQRIELNVGKLVGVEPGGNPHRWYSPPDVHKVIDQIAADYKRLAPRDAAYFEQRKATFTSASLAAYDGLVAGIKATYGGVPIGASESIFTPMAEALGLDVLTPTSFLDAVSEGGEPTAADKTTCDDQIKGHEIKAYVFNSQNSTPAVKEQVKLAKGNGVPVTSVTETLVPATASFQDWQADQLRRLQTALAQATSS